MRNQDLAQEIRGEHPSQRSGTRMKIASFTRAISEENESLPTSFIGWTRAVKGFTVTRSFACGSRDAWKETTQSGRPSPSRSIGSDPEYHLSLLKLENGWALRAVNPASEI